MRKCGKYFSRYTHKSLLAFCCARAVALRKYLSKHFPHFLTYLNSLYNTYMKILTKVIVGIVAILVVVGLVYILFFEKVGAPTIHENVSQISSDWKTYTDPVTNLSLQAPADFSVKKHNSEYSFADLFLLEIPTTTPYVHTHLVHLALIGINTPGYTCATAENYGPFASTTQFIINGVSFTRTANNGVGAGNLYQTIDYSTNRNGLCYNVGLYIHSTNGEGFYTDDAAQIAQVDAQQKADITALFKLFDQIASTIKFTKNP